MGVSSHTVKMALFEAAKRRAAEARFKQKTVDAEGQEIQVNIIGKEHARFYFNLTNRLILFPG